MKSRQGSITSLMNKIMSNPEISKENKVYAQEMLAFMQASGAKINTVLKHLYCFEKYIVVIGRNIDAKKNAEIPHSLLWGDSFDFDGGLILRALN